MVPVSASKAEPPEAERPAPQAGAPAAPARGKAPSAPAEPQPAPPAPEEPKAPPPKAEPVKPLIRKREVEILLNGKPMVLPPKENGQPYYVMDLLERSGVDFEKLEGPVHLAVNGKECGFSQMVKDRDSITVC